MPRALWSPEKIVVVGMGGIGTHLIFSLLAYVRHKKREVLLVDGDVYTEGNLDRQLVLNSDIGKQKATSWAQALAGEFKMLGISAKATYVGEKNIHELDFEKAAVFIGVDNFPAKSLILKYAQKFKNVVMYCGGNELEDGSVITYLRENGEELLPHPFKFHPELENPKGKNPADLSCAELAKLESGHQVIWANAQAAVTMGTAFHNFMTGDRKRAAQFGEHFFDIRTGAVVPKMRLVPESEVKPKGTKKAKAKGKRSKKEALPAATREELVPVAAVPKAEGQSPEAKDELGLPPALPEAVEPPEAQA
jgi:hypothetical protein